MIPFIEKMGRVYLGESVVGVPPQGVIINDNMVVVVEWG
jgi:hypothetical protein